MHLLHQGWNRGHVGWIWRYAGITARVRLYRISSISLLEQLFRHPAAGMVIPRNNIYADTSKENVACELVLGEHLLSTSVVLQHVSPSVIYDIETKWNREKYATRLTMASLG